MTPQALNGAEQTGNPGQNRARITVRASFTDPGLVDLDPSRTPHLAAIGGRWAVLAAQDTYAQGVRAFVDGLLAQATTDTRDTTGAERP